MKKQKKSGFTLIEMLVVIAIVAILVAIIVPVVSSSTKKASAATDAANLRSILAEANILTMDDGPEAIASAKLVTASSKCFPSAKAYIAYQNPGFMAIYYVDGSNYYGLDYFSEVAETGSSTKALSGQPSGYDWYKVGGDGE